MPLQLIYTSAPRLLQAGRTGFGTVAAHPGIPSWLVAEIERASQFSRVPGLDAARIVVRHMVFGEGDRVHHVLSRIQDAGADYTGRTNHIAHHFIFTAAEAAKATAHGVTPVDALAFLESHKLWQTSWDGEPRPLGDDTILPVDSIPQTITLPAETYWGALVPGRPECAAILAPGKTSEACWIVYPHGWSDAIVYAMGESLALHSNPWGVSFANNLQPTDNEQQIAWRGIPADSPLLPKAQSSVRPCIDLTNPGALPIQPVPEFVEEARTGSKPLPKPRAAAPSATSVRPDSGDRPAQVIALLSKTNERPRRNPYAFPLAVMVAILVLLLAVGGGIWGYDLYSKNKAISEELAGLRAEIMELVSPIHNVPDLSIFENPGELATLLEFLKEVSNEDTARAEESLTKIKGISSEWNDWRSVCNNLLESKKGQMEKKTLADLYAKASQGDALDDEQWNQFQTLAKKLHPEDEKWGNAVKAVSFLKNPDSDGVSFWMQNRGLPADDLQSTQLLEKVRQEITKIKIKDFNERIAGISAREVFNQELVKLLADWPEGSELQKFLSDFSKSQSAQTDGFKKFNLAMPVFLTTSPSKEVSQNKSENGNIYPNENSLPPIYLIKNENEKLNFHPKEFAKPMNSDRWATTNSLPINWNEIPYQASAWSDSKKAWRFKIDSKESKAYYIINDNMPEGPKIDFIVILLDALNIDIYEYDQIAAVSKYEIQFKNDFLSFLNRLYKKKEINYSIFLKLNYQNDIFKLKNIKTQISEKTKSIALPNLDQVMCDEKSKLDKKLDENSNQIQNLKTNLENKKSEIANFRFEPKELNPWEDFRKLIDKAINANTEKKDFKEFTNIFNQSESHNKVESFLRKYSEIQNKEKFTDALSNFPEEQRNWFFFDGKEWSKESQEKFLKQFDKEKYNIIKTEIENLQKQIKAQNDTKERLKQEEVNLEKLKTDQKATLNFYLEETDTEPFLTTEVTIPFASEKPTDASTPPTPPAL